MRAFLVLLLLLSASTFSVAQTNSNNAFLIAEPAEVPAGGGIGNTDLSWESETEARLFVVGEDDSLKEMGRGKTGKINAGFILPGRTYLFRLYSSENPNNPLTEIKVTGTGAVDYRLDY